MEAATLSSFSCLYWGSLDLVLQGLCHTADPFLDPLGRESRSPGGLKKEVPVTEELAHRAARTFQLLLVWVFKFSWTLLTSLPST